MAQVKTTETKRVNVIVEAPWGTYRESYARKRKENILTIKFAFDVIKKKFSSFMFRTTTHAGWFAIRDLQKLRALYKAIGETLDEVEKLSNDS